MAAAVAGHLAKVEPGTAGWRISVDYALRRTERVAKAEAILLRAQALHPKVAMITSTHRKNSARQRGFMPISDESLNIRNFDPGSTPNPIQ
jgi:hypothetical protein